MTTMLLRNTIQPNPATSNVLIQLLILASLLFLPAATIQAAPNQRLITPDHSLQQAIDNANEADTLLLAPGVYQGNFVINKPLTLQCQQGAELNGNAVHDTVKITAPNVTIKGCSILNWGDDLTTMDAGIVVKKTADNVLIKNNYFKGPVFGVFLDAAPNSKIHNNRIEGIIDIRSQDRGNGIHMYATQGADIAFNEVWHTRDGVYIDTSNKNTIRSNEFHHLRYGVHYMYSHHNRVLDNYTHHTRSGYALMQSKYLTVIGNRSEFDQNYGILMNFITHSTVENNHISRVQQGTNPAGGQAIRGAEGKGLFLYNSLFNRLVGNTVQHTDLGIHLTAGSEDNVIAGNNFIANRQQVKYVATRKQEWSNKEAGNFWSDYLGWDRDNNGIGDIVYEPNDSIDRLLWKYPSAKVLMHSPAIEALRWVQRKFPVLKSPGVTDSFPLMRPSAQPTHHPTATLTTRVTPPMNEEKTL